MKGYLTNTCYILCNWYGHVLLYSVFNERPTGMFDNECQWDNYPSKSQFEKSKPSKYDLKHGACYEFMRFRIIYIPKFLNVYLDVSYTN